MTSDVEKNEDDELPVPTVWRPTLSAIIQAFKDKDYRLTRGVAAVEPVSDEVATMIARSVEYYGSDLAVLPEQAWETSVYRWMWDYWEVIVDLYTVQEGQSDLAMFVQVFEDGDAYRFKVHSVHVP